MSATGTYSLINGIAADYLNINDRAIHYGDGLFETILCSDNRLFYWHQHYQRLKTSCEKIQLYCPAEQLLLDDIKILLAENDNSAGSALVIKIIISRGSGERGYKISKAMVPTRLVILSDMAMDYSSLLSAELFMGELYVCQHQVSINESLAGLKHLNRLENVMARNEWANTARRHDAEQPVVDGLMVNASQYAIEGTMSNIFAVKDQQLITPDLTQSGVNGIMRDIVMDIANKMGIAVSIVDIHVDELLAMDELFITNSLIGMKAITRFKQKQYPELQITKLIFEKLLNTKDDYVQAV